MTNLKRPTHLTLEIYLVPEELKVYLDIFPKTSRHAHLAPEELLACLTYNKKFINPFLQGAWHILVSKFKYVQVYFMYLNFEKELQIAGTLRLLSTIVYAIIVDLQELRLQSCDVRGHDAY